MGVLFDMAAGGEQSASQLWQGGVAYQMGTLNQSYYNTAANSALQAGESAAAKTEMKGTQTIGAQTAGFASSGVDASSGSAMAAMADSRMMSSLDAATQRNNAAREAWGYQVKGSQAFVQGELDDTKDRNDAIGTALGTASKEFSDLSGYAKMGS